jgi:3',5'-cyclic AMP phosphodiesterase CpdA
MVFRVAAAMKQADHLVVTGDVTNFSLERELEEARKLLDGVSGRRGDRRAGEPRRLLAHDQR